MPATWRPRSLGPGHHGGVDAGARLELLVQDLQRREPDVVRVAPGLHDLQLHDATHLQQTRVARP